MNRKVVFILIVMFILLSYAYFIFIQPNITGYFYCIIIASGLYLLGVMQFLKIEFHNREIFAIIIAVFILKIAAITVAPIGSDDYYRYLWDGKVIANGINPFQFAPNSKELAHLQSEILPDLVSYPSIKTIYFPISQLAFVAAYMIGGESSIGLKIILLLSDIILTIGFIFLLRREKIDLKFVLLYTLSPLIFYQIFVDAHIDLLGMMFFLFAVYNFKDKKTIAALMLGLSIAVKPTFLLAVPIFFFYEKSIMEKMKWLIIPSLILVVSFLPFSFTANPLDTLVNYSKNWTFNGAGYNFLALFLNDNLTIRIILLILFVIIYLLILRYNKEVVSSIYYSLIALFLLSPIVHPWYVIWLIVPLVIHFRFSGVVYLTTISLVFYTVLIYQTTGIWNDYGFILILEYVPVLFFVFYELSKTKFISEKLVGRLKS